MQTTLRFADQLLRDAKAAAAQNGVSLTRFIEDSVRQRLSAHRSANTRRRVRLPVSTAKGWLAPGFSNLQQAIEAIEVEDDKAWVRKHLPAQR